jgi:hypothetical protein
MTKVKSIPAKKKPAARKNTATNPCDMVPVSHPSFKLGDNIELQVYGRKYRGIVGAVVKKRG